MLGGTGHRTYGWKRKFNERYKEVVRNKREYLDTPMPAQYLRRFIYFMEYSLVAKERYLRSKKPALYDWLYDRLALRS